MGEGPKDHPVSTKPSTPRNPDQRVGDCIVAKTKSGWAWFCVICGDGGISGRANSWRNLVLLKASDHAKECPGPPSLSPPEPV